MPTLDPALASLCHTEAVNVLTAELPYLAPPGTAARLQQATDAIQNHQPLPPLPSATFNTSGLLDSLNVQCRPDAINKGSLGVQCFRWAWLTTIAQIPYTVNPNSTVGPMAGRYYQGCAGT